MITETKVLTAAHVWAVVWKCLFKQGEDIADRIVVEGIAHNVDLHRGRIEQHRQEIHDMLAELPDAFKTHAGPGESFPLMCFDRRGNQWATLHITMEQLVQLGIAIGEVEYTVPRDDWKNFPGGPYIMVKQ